MGVERVLDPKTGSPLRSQLGPLDRVEAPDKYTAVFHLKTPFAFLYDKGRDLFTIGFNVTDHRLDPTRSYGQCRALASGVPSRGPHRAATPRIRRSPQSQYGGHTSDRHHA